MIDKNNICIFAHYNSNQKVDEYAFEYAQSLHDCGFNILFISNSLVGEAFKTKVSQMFGHNRFKIFERPNTGNDFGAWQYAFENDLIPANTENILLTNDSIIGPLFDLQPMFESMNKRSLDYWGLTDSYHGGWHLQSYFIFFSKSVFSSQSFKNIFKQDFNSLPKKDIIEKGEIYLTQELKKNNFKGEAFVPYTLLDDVTDGAITYNPTHFFWDKLIENYQFPFIKREVILQNPDNLESVENLFTVIRQASDYNVKNIKELIISNNGVKQKEPEAKAINIVCHLYYAHSIYYFLSKLSVLKKYNAAFFFNLSYTLNKDDDFIEILKKSFPGCVVINEQDNGRDIVGKFALLELIFKIEKDSDLTLIIHDKFSPHTPTGKEWRNKLFKIIDEQELPRIFQQFSQSSGTGIIGAKEFIKNEFNADANNFDCTSSEILKHEIEKYNLNLTNYNFIAGTIFWIRTGILKSFFSQHHPMKIRQQFEDGNALDFINGTIVHSWERLFSMIATDGKYKIKGI